MHPALRRRPLLYNKTLAIFHFFDKKTPPFSTFFTKHTPFSTFFTKKTHTPVQLLSTGLLCWGRQCEQCVGVRELHGDKNLSPSPTVPDVSIPIRAVLP